MVQKLTLFFILYLPVAVYSQSPTVPSRMEFAGIKLRLTEGARRIIQKDVDALTRSPKYFNIKVERAKTYFPVIERVFREEGLHDDFKYLVLQESALIPDAVSSSDAVGFWQFKDFTAMEVGLRVDSHIDERMNIVSSSRGAARYMKKNNQYFDNWLHALQAYQMGPGGAMRVLGQGDEGANSMVIDENTYWYVRKFLAHKIAFQDAVDGPGAIKLVEYTNGKNKSLKDISRETGISLQQLKDYNKWLKKGKIPADKEYVVVLPVSEIDNINLVTLKTDAKVEKVRTLEYKFPKADKFPQIEDYEAALNGNIADINRLPAVIAVEGDKIPMLARKGDVDLSKFLKYNDLSLTDQVVPGQVYYYKRKRAKAQAHFYVAHPGETLWSVSQKFGIRLKKLKSKNRITDDEKLKAGRVLWLRYIRPERIEIEYRGIPEPVNGENLLVKAKETRPESNPVDEEPETTHVTVQKQEVQEAGRLKTDMKPEGTVAETSEGQVMDTTTGEEWAEESVKRDERVRRTHFVEAGETLYAISNKYNVTVRDLLDWNQLAISDGIMIGQELIVFQKPVNENEPDTQPDAADTYTYHTVSEGETLYNIARSYDVTIEDLMNWNNKEDFNIDLGEQIRIKRQKQ